MIMIQFRIWHLFVTILLVALVIVYMRFAHSASFEIVNQSGEQIEVELVNCRNHTTTRYSPVWIANGKAQSLSIAVQIYDYTSIRIRDQQGKYIRWGREYKELPYGKVATYVVYRKSFREDGEQVGYVVSDTQP